MLEEWKKILGLVIIDSSKLMVVQLEGNLGKHGVK